MMEEVPPVVSQQGDDGSHIPPLASAPAADTASTSDSSPFFSRTFSDLTLFDLASALLDDKPSSSPARDEGRGDDAANATVSNYPWRSTSPPTLATSEAAADMPNCEGRDSPPALSQHLAQSLASFAQVTTPSRRKGAKRARTTEPEATQPVATQPEATQPEATLAELYGVCCDSPSRCEEVPLAPATEPSVDVEGCARTRAPDDSFVVVPPLLPPPLPAPQRVSCLFVEVSPHDLWRTSGTRKSVRQLLSRWCGLEPTHEPAPAAASSTKRHGAAGTRHGPHSEPALRVVLFLAPTPDSLRQSLLSWTLQPFAENAVLLPLFGFCTTPQVPDTTPRTSEPRMHGAAVPTPPTTLSPTSRGSRRVTFAEPLEVSAGPTRGLDETVQSAVSMFHVDVTSSVALTQSVECREALLRAGLRGAALHSCVSAAVTYIDKNGVAQAAQGKEGSKASTTKRARTGKGSCTNSVMTHHVSAGHGSSTTLAWRSVDAHRIRAFTRLASWNALARLLWSSPRRPAMVLRHVRSAATPHASRWLCGAVCAALSHDDTLSLTTAARECRARLAEAPALRITWHQRAMLIAFTTFLFGPDVVSTAVNVLRMHGEQIEPTVEEPVSQTQTDKTVPVPRTLAGHDHRDGVFVKGFCCVCLGYQRYRVTATLRRYVHTSLDLHLVALWESSSARSGMEASMIDVYTHFFPSPISATELVVPEGPWRRVVPRFSCTCVPRSFERVRRAGDGDKLCRHVAELLFYTLQRQCLVIPSAAEDGAADVRDDGGDTECFEAESTSAQGVPRVEQLIAASTRPVHERSPFTPDPSWPQQGDVSLPPSASPATPAAAGRTEHVENARPSPSTTGATAERKRHRPHRGGAADQKGQSSANVAHTPRHHQPRSSLSSSSQVPSAGSGVGTTDPSFHQRALEYSLGLIRARAAELIQNHLLVQQTSGGTSQPAPSSHADEADHAPLPSSQPLEAPAVVSEVSALAWLQALLEVPQPMPPSEGRAPPSPGPPR